jgi:squalene synthase HpnC
MARVRKRKASRKHCVRSHVAPSDNAGPGSCLVSPRRMSVDHYENFPVASILCPPALRPAVTAIYHFARKADDIADEGEATADERREQLLAYRECLFQANAHDAKTSSAWPHVFGPLRQAIHTHGLPVALLDDLLRAFLQDLTQHTYDDRPALLDYCRRSANPVGRLLLHLYGVGGDTALRQSDAICTALQLANFWQDLSIDTRRGRLYLPLSDCNRIGVSPATLLAATDSPGARRLIADAVAWTRSLMLSGAPLAHTLPGRAGWELRLVVQGGLRILDKIEGRGFDSLLVRPKLGASDVPAMAWRALRMRHAAAALQEARR